MRMKVLQADAKRVSLRLSGDVVATEFRGLFGQLDAVLNSRLWELAIEIERSTALV